MPAESKSLSEFPRALEVLSGALLLISNPSGQDSFDTNSALLTEVAQAMLDVHYTQELGDVSVFDAIKNTRVLSGTTTPTAIEGANGQLYVKYQTVSNVDTVIGMYFKKDGAWLEISLGGGNTDYIECTQAEYDAWEQGGTLDPDTLYFITDGNIGNDIIDDSTTSASKVWSSDKTDSEIQAVASDIPTKTSELNNDSGYITTTLIDKVIVTWGTKLEFHHLKSHYILMVGDYLYAIWLAGAGYSNVSIRDISTNISAKGSDSATLGNITVTKITDGIRVEVASNSTISVMG